MLHGYTHGYTVKLLGSINSRFLTAFTKTALLLYLHTLTPKCYLKIDDIAQNRTNLGSNQKECFIYYTVKQHVKLSTNQRPIVSTFLTNQASAEVLMSER